SVDANPNNNTDVLTTSIAPQQVDLAITHIATPSIVEVGGTVTFAISGVNRGSGRATSVVVNDVIPPGFHIIPGSEQQVSTITKARGLLDSRLQIQRSDVGLRAQLR